MSNDCPAVSDTPARAVIVDARHMQPPEPLEHSLATIRVLKSGEYMCLLIHREPVPLYGILEQYGFDFLVRTRQGPEPEWEVRVWRKGDEIAADAARR